MSAPPTPRYPVPKPIEIEFKHVEGVSIMMDVYIPDKAIKESPAPILLWWHGQGTRKAVAPHMLYAPAKHNLCIVSVDYRLAPQTRFPAILSDCKSAIDFLHSDEFTKMTGGRVDASKLFVSGSSAGGWLALLAGTGIGYKASGVEPPQGISGIIAIYPISDLLDSFWTTKQRPTVYLDRIIEFSEMETFLNPNSEKTSWSEATGKRSMFYHYMVQEGILKELLLDGTGLDPITYSIAQNIRTRKFLTPPTYVITGNADTKVPHRQSLDVVAAYKSVGIDDIEYYELDGLDHRFDDNEREEMESLYAFIKKLL
ncbi:hypothetical protein AGABI1DRAFT_116328 [Agaricus bisporus var. burnettii JB137-S8]|uniref:BD-FAE-like domain-containing protein n=1 Tax=Agaricus bisporus var. burnettii (strain JB137-S8 / ATCC MYA-4627 / FGSC 10392) TaxID=597362 RepID=K5XLR8_AGABU|nr:uncharacterized protein AGABI1DRAFT_116328 [Agaricus bisporus var. burnettii JB137-S8]EKM75485.1 hypothetical protein AGABI1DRAFT_116328 [Agaricus bisporus var. burnettii JB137-S8]